MSVIPDGMIFTDRNGTKWRKAEEYQDFSVNAPGWLLLSSSTREELTYSEVFMRYAFRDGERRYLQAEMGKYPAVDRA